MAAEYRPEDLDIHDAIGIDVVRVLFENHQTWGSFAPIQVK
jgi:hypothetical protein